MQSCFMLATSTWQLLNLGYFTAFTLIQYLVDLGAYIHTLAKTNGLIILFQIEMCTTYRITKVSVGMFKIIFQLVPKLLKIGQNYFFFQKAIYFAVCFN